MMLMSLLLLPPLFLLLHYELNVIQVLLKENVTASIIILKHHIFHVRELIHENNNSTSIIALLFAMIRNIRLDNK